MHQDDIDSVYSKPNDGPPIRTRTQTHRVTNKAKSHIHRIRQQLQPSPQEPHNSTLVQTNNDNSLALVPVPDTQPHHTSSSQSNTYSQAVSGHSMEPNTTITDGNERLQTMDVSGGIITINKEDLKTLVTSIMTDTYKDLITFDQAKTLIDKSIPDTSKYVQTNQVSSMITNYVLEQDLITASTTASMITSTKNTLHSTINTKINSLRNEVTSTCNALSESLDLLNQQMSSQSTQNSGLADAITALNKNIGSSRTRKTRILPAIRRTKPSGAKKK